jgi:hypothetical protein
MSYNVRDDAGTFGGQAQIELNNGAGAPTIVRMQVYEAVGLFGIAAAGATGKYDVFIAPPTPSAASVLAPLGTSYQILGGTINYDTASSSGTVAVEICPAGTASGSGNNVLSTTNVSTATAATNTPVSLTLNTNIDNLLIGPLGRINVIFGGTATGLVNFTIVLYLGRV